MGKKTNGATNGSLPVTKKPTAKTRRTEAKEGATKPKRKKPLTIGKVAAVAGAAVAVAAGEAIAKIARAPRPRRSTTPRKTTKARGTGGIETPRLTYTRDEIALRAYFISERRRAECLPGDPAQDWLEAERQLSAENS